MDIARQSAKASGMEAGQTGGVLPDINVVYSYCKITISMTSSEPIL